MYVQILEKVFLAITKLLSYAFAFLAGKESQKNIDHEKLLNQEKQSSVVRDSVARADDAELDRLRRKWER